MEMGRKLEMGMKMKVQMKMDNGMGYWDRVGDGDGD